MDKSTLSNYGWIVICTLVLVVMIALSTPFGAFVSDAVKSTTYGLFDTQNNALEAIGVNTDELDAPIFSDDGFAYYGRKYSMVGADGSYLVCDKEANITIYTANDEPFAQIPSACVTCDARTMTITGTGNYDGVYYVSKNGHEVYMKDGDEKFIVCVEIEYCTHEYEGHSNWLQRDFSDLNNPKVMCLFCGKELDTVYKDGVLYGYNLYMAWTEWCADAWYDSSLNGYCALILDHTKEHVEFEDQINGKDVVLVTGIYTNAGNNSINPSLKTMKLPNNLRIIDAYAFYDCDNLISIPNIPKTVTQMSYAFQDCDSITNLNGVVIPSGAKINGTFTGCKSLSNIDGLIIEEGITEMNGTFSDCTALTDASGLVIPKSIKSLHGTFSNSGLVNVPNLSNLTNLTDMTQTFKDCDNIVDASELNLPNGLISMDSTFMYCSNLKHAPNIPSTVENMNQTFYVCTNLTEIPNIEGVNKLKNLSATFWGCSSLTYVNTTIPSSVTNCNNTFANCPSLQGEIRINCTTEYNHWGTPAKMVVSHTQGCTH